MDSISETSVVCSSRALNLVIFLSLKDLVSIDWGVGRLCLSMIANMPKWSAISDTMIPDVILL